jgi:hypothetical protein
MFSAITIKIPMAFFTEIGKLILKYLWKHKRPQITKAVLSKMYNARVITKPDFKLYSRAITIKTVWYSLKNRHDDQWNKTEGSFLNACRYSQLIFGKGAQSTQWRKYSLFYSPLIFGTGAQSTQWRKDNLLTNFARKTENPHVED